MITSHAVRRAHALLVPLVVLVVAVPLAGCFCGGRDWSRSGHDEGSSWNDPDDHSQWPAATAPNGAAGAGGAIASRGDNVTGDGGAATDAGAADAGRGAAGAGGSGTTPPADAHACGCDGGVKKRAPVCQFDNQCGPRARCRDGACERECTTPGSCGTGQVCTQGYCQTPPGGGGQCVYDTDCSGGATCIDGACHAHCAGDAQCREADRCVAGVCQADPGPWPECRASSECATGRSCINAVCRTPCAGDADCCEGSSGPTCRGGVCVTAHEAAPQCRLSADCGGGHACIDGACGG